MKYIHTTEHTINLLQYDDNMQRDIRYLLQDSLKKDSTFWLLNPDYCLTKQESHQFLSNLEQLLKGIPLAYVLGHQPFWSLDFFVNESTLIPRQDTEYLVEMALVKGDELLENLKKQNTSPNHISNIDVLDLGTGTGAIAICLKHERPHWTVLATDKSEEAIKLAHKNANALEKEVDFFVGNWFDALKAHEGKFHMIVSNPPYIHPEDEHLENLSYEPLSALVAKDEGLADIKTIITDAKHHLFAEGWLLLEHGYDQGDKVAEIFANNGYVNIQTLKDYAHNDRVTVAQYK